MTQTPAVDTVAPTDASAPDETWLGPPARDRVPLRASVVVAMFAFLAITPILQFCGVAVRTQSSITAPTFTWPTFWDGRYMTVTEQWLRESSPLTYQMRGIYNESRFVMGLLDSDRVLIGKEGWMFSRGILNSGTERLRSGKAKRMAAIKAIQDRATHLGVQLVAVVAPDKVTVYPEMLPRRSAAMDNREACYGEILDELRVTGIATIDLKTPLIASKSVISSLYRRTDSHWSDSGARVAAVAVSNTLRSAPYADDLGVQVALRLEESYLLGPGDIVGMLGVRMNSSGYRSLDDMLRVKVPNYDSPVLGNLLEVWVNFQAAEIAIPPNNPVQGGYEKHMTAARIALCGDSFSLRSFRWRLLDQLRQLLDWTYVVANAIPINTVSRCLDDIEKGQSKAKIIVWEFVQRKYVDGPW
jgi:hypothetical protein